MGIQRGCVTGRGGRGPGHLIPIKLSAMLSHALFIAQRVSLKNPVPQLFQEVCLYQGCNLNAVYTKSGREASDFSELIPETINLNLEKHPDLGSPFLRGTGNDDIRGISSFHIDHSMFHVVIPYTIASQSTKQGEDLYLIYEIRYQKGFQK